MTRTRPRVCELLVDLDEGLQEWRYSHIKMVRADDRRPARHRRLGRRHLPTTTVARPTFPDLWAMRSMG